jgi:hypothetical protein
LKEARLSYQELRDEASEAKEYEQQESRDEPKNSGGIWTP